MHDLILKIYVAAKYMLDRTEGQGMAEYALAVALIAFGCIAGEGSVATSVNRVFVSLGTMVLDNIVG